MIASVQPVVQLGVDLLGDTLSDIVRVNGPDLRGRITFSGLYPRAGTFRWRIFAFDRCGGSDETGMNKVVIVR